ncbi:hypothetical protein P7K49_018365 [Saguinus oedipus]|uniref:Uncharacterized protein n=1 Tax=Saguinus oedipus TaxID=9490 RepID=A0ABQ9V561_SAGOE|nr:hypothetical protein P7K49_018365 [Saguinus oedipus]
MAELPAPSIPPAQPLHCSPAPERLAIHKQGERAVLAFLVESQAVGAESELPGKGEGGLGLNGTHLSPKGCADAVTVTLLRELPDYSAAVGSQLVGQSGLWNPPTFSPPSLRAKVHGTQVQREKPPAILPHCLRGPFPYVASTVRQGLQGLEAGARKLCPVKERPQASFWWDRHLPTEPSSFWA